MFPVLFYLSKNLIILIIIISLLNIGFSNSTPSAIELFLQLFAFYHFADIGMYLRTYICRYVCVLLSLKTSQVDNCQIYLLRERKKGNYCIKGVIMYTGTYCYVMVFHLSVNI